MLNIKTFVCNMIEENTYLVWDETKECVIIDCGTYYADERKELVDTIRTEGLRPVHLLATHGHLDHNFGINTIAEEYGLNPKASEKDAPMMAALKEQGATLFGMTIDYEFPTVTHFLKEKEEVRFGSHTFTVLPTPGHTQGSVTFYCKDEEVAFTGDTLFRGSVGRTDFPGGSMFQLISSLRELAQLPDTTRIYAGHGEPTTIGYELAHNPYMDR
ncbi:MBL fold metallo-hydrolase [Prevotella ihumii]|uniref:MBL fold metallo-hydrolase n=1 Tax=Prevotella ihumii TaxID=1917878 RepID=UPI00098102CF|nr:MBL fold metallo-hydrolase [Prevotella ihumii]